MKRSLPLIENCDNCGACCMEQTALPVHLISSHAGIKPVSPLPPELRRELEETVERFNREGWPQDGTPCIWYDLATKRCKHYQYRPDVCRDGLAVGSIGCRAWRQQYGIDVKRRYRMVNGKMVTT